MRVSTTKSKYSESFYITKSYINNQGKSTSKIIRKLGTLSELSNRLGTDREGVMAWAREQAKYETEKYKNESKTVLIPFSSDRQLDYHREKFFEGGYLFLQSVYYALKLDVICRKIKRKYKLKYDLNAVLSDLVYIEILKSAGKFPSFKEAEKFLEPPSYKFCDACDALSVLAGECDFIQSEVHKNSFLSGERINRTVYYDCTGFCSGEETALNAGKYGKNGENNAESIIQAGLLTDEKGFPLAFTFFTEKQKGIQSMTALAERSLRQFGCGELTYCSDECRIFMNSGNCSNSGGGSSVIIKSVKELSAQKREWALNREGFKRLSDNKTIDIANLSDNEKYNLYYKEKVYHTKDRQERFMIIYSSQYAAYQKDIRSKQASCEKGAESGGVLEACGRKPDSRQSGDKEKYDGFYIVYTDLIDAAPNDIVQICERRRRIEGSFRAVKADFTSCPSDIKREHRLKAYFLVCFLSLLICRNLEKGLNGQYTCEEIVQSLRGMNFADVEEQGYMPLYGRTRLTDDLHDMCGFRTDYQFISKRKMREIQKWSKGRK